MRALAALPNGECEIRRTIEIMEKGKIIFLNGVTSAGKTSIVDAMQNRGDIFFYAMANDLFQDMVSAVGKFLCRAVHFH